MSEPFLGEIRMVGCNFAPRGWAFCDGQLLAVSQNDALFSLLGTIYGGDGRTTFGLPDLRGRFPMHPGAGPGLTTRRVGEKGGSETVTLASNQMPSHSHTVNATAETGTDRSPNNSMLATSGAAMANYNFSSSSTVAMKANTVANAGGNQPHTNLQPFLCVNFIIALVGIYPSRS